MDSTQEAASTDETLQILADRRRRQLLRHLAENGDEGVVLDDLVAVLADGDPRSTGDGREPAERIATELHHTHLPKLADAGVVDYDRQNATVRYRRREAVEELLQVVSETLE